MSNSFKIILIVFTGSGFGGVARYGMQTWIFKMYPFTFPLGTFIVNTIGCLLIGLFYALIEKGNLLTHKWRLALTTGLCGGFTTSQPLHTKIRTCLEQATIFILVYIF